MSAHKAPGRFAWLVLAAVSVIVVTAFGAFVAVSAVWERLLWGRKDAVKGDGPKDVHPGLVPVYVPRDSWAQDQERDG